MRKQHSDNKTSAVIVIFLAGIMIFSVVGFIYVGDSQQSQTIGGLKYILTNQGWMVNVEGHQYYFDFLPTEISFGLDPLVSSAMNSSEMVYITYDPESEDKERLSQIQYEIKEALNSKEIFVKNAFTKDNDYGMTVITCDDATSSVPVIELRTSGNFSISYENGCIDAVSEPSDFLMLRDILVYSALGII
ncbi:hypothetical protein ACFLZX_04650 [Nanoarchaeota archaeon]